MKTFKLKDLPPGTTKGTLAKLMGLQEPFDYALPQTWLDNFVEKTGLDYHLVLGTTFWSYDKATNGPISGVEEVQSKIAGA